MLDDYAEAVIEKDEIVETLNQAAMIYLSLKLPKESYWYNKSNFFSLIIILAQNIDYFNSIKPTLVKSKLNEFHKNLPKDYELAAKEGVNNKKERVLRDNHLKKLLLK